ncbi:hypothetical protein HAX54_027661 [Datura stramonium]|uniref:Uncharacterized protein n=1 Tax=Datura stramonium TaxID=4076 RepID=A0ABS8V4D5_DATST|nr:hypothetical protein [Datura stramonium]
MARGRLKKDRPIIQLSDVKKHKSNRRIIEQDLVDLIAMQQSSRAVTSSDDKANVGQLHKSKDKQIETASGLKTSDMMGSQDTQVPIERKEEKVASNWINLFAGNRLAARDPSTKKAGKGGEMVKQSKEQFKKFVQEWRVKLVTDNINASPRMQMEDTSKENEWQTVRSKYAAKNITTPVSTTINIGNGFSPLGLPEMAGSSLQTTDQYRAEEVDRGPSNNTQF